MYAPARLLALVPCCVLRSSWQGFLTGPSCADSVAEAWAFFSAAYVRTACISTSGSRVQAAVAGTLICALSQEDVAVSVAGVCLFVLLFRGGIFTQRMYSNWRAGKRWCALHPRALRSLHPCSTCPAGVCRPGHMQTLAHTHSSALLWEALLPGYGADAPFSSLSLVATVAASAQVAAVAALLEHTLTAELPAIQCRTFRLWLPAPVTASALRGLHGSREPASRPSQPGWHAGPQGGCA